MATKSKNIVLLGDSILDNINYVSYRDGTCVTDQLKLKILKQDLNYMVYNYAVDGYTTYLLLRKKITELPKNTDYIVLSIGGNDGLESLSKFNNIKSFLPWNFIKILYQTKKKFTHQYTTILNKLTELYPNAKIITLTIYYPVFNYSKIIQFISNIGVNILSNVIINTSMKYDNTAIIDLRRVFNNHVDYANSIEPNVPGGDKIVNNILHILTTHAFDKTGLTKTHRIYCLTEYSKDLDIKMYMKNHWCHMDNDEQKGNQYTRFFRRSFRENNSFSQFWLKFACLCVAIVLIWLWINH